jgi:hypothetical protein
LNIDQLTLVINPSSHVNRFNFNFFEGLTKEIFILTPHSTIKAEINGSLNEIFQNDQNRFDFLNQNHQIIYYNNVYHFHDWVHNITIQIDTENEVISLHTNYFTDSVESVKFTNVSNLSTNDLIVNVKKAVIVWSVLGIDSSVYECNYDGSDQTVLHSTSRQVKHLTVDYNSHKYFFVDITDFSLYSMGMNSLHFYLK